MEVQNASDGFAAIAQPTRLEALRLLVRAGPQGVTAGALATARDVAAPTLTFHLKELTRANLASARRSGRRVYYAANYGGLRQLIDFLMAECCQGDPRLCGPYVVKEAI